MTGGRVDVFTGSEVAGGVEGVGEEDSCLLQEANVAAKMPATAERDNAKACLRRKDRVFFASFITPL